MAISMCQKCGKMISISSIPGGNPTALSNPDVFALGYGICKHCGGIFGDECIPKKRSLLGSKPVCPKCGKSIHILGLKK